MYFNNNMMPQMPNNINMNNMINNYNLNNNYINIIFRVSGQEQIIQRAILVSLDERIGDVIQKYRNMTNNNDTSLIFIFNGNKLNFSIGL